MDDLFVSSVSDINAKSAQDLMARNWFSLAKHRQTAIEHRIGKDYIRVTGNKKFGGIANIWDHDIIIFLISQIIKVRDYDGTRAARRIRFTFYDYLKFKGRTKNVGVAYDNFFNALMRLQSTFVETSLSGTQANHFWRFNWITEVRRVEYGDDDQTKSRAEFEVVVAEWLFEVAVKNNMILTLNHDYFRIRSSLERFLYLFARKEAGNQRKGWVESFENLHRKSASENTLRYFKRDVKKVLARTNGEILDYTFTIDEDKIHIKRKSKSLEKK